MPEFDFKKAPKQLIDGYAMAFNQHLVTMAFMVGQGAGVFAMVPEDAKAMLQAVAKTIELYEKQYGTIMVSPGKSVPSPINLSDNK